jgi:hypothetical protein
MPIAGLRLTAAALAVFSLGVASASAAAVDRAPAAGPSIAAAPQPAADADDDAAPNCLLPGQIHSLGGIAMVTPRRPVTLAPAECAARGGEPLADPAAPQ